MSSDYILEIKEKNYNGKVMLVGEYAVTIGGAALTVPIENFYGKLYHDPDHKEKDLRWTSFLNHVQKNCPNIDDHALATSIDNGLKFSSNIPQGYGLGSSGALVAAIYDNFVINRADDSTETLKKQLATIENAFHGNSSGIDPLTSYMNDAVLVDSKSKCTILHSKISGEQFFLIDTGLPRNTKTLIENFQKKMQNSKDFKDAINQLKLYNDALIEGILQGNTSIIQQFMHQVSEVQFKHMGDWIPKKIKDLWTTGLETTSYKIKLCGAGGGGMMLGFGSKVLLQEMGLDCFDIMQDPKK